MSKGSPQAMVKCRINTATAKDIERANGNHLGTFKPSAVSWVKDKIPAVDIGINSLLLLLLDITFPMLEAKREGIKRLR